MKNFIIKILLFAFSLTSWGAFAQGQTAKTPEERANVITSWMKTNLQLTPEQEAPIAALNLKYANLNEQLKTSTASRMQKFQTLKANDEAKDKELKSILSAGQLKTYEAKKAELKEKFKEERAGN